VEQQEPWAILCRHPPVPEVPEHSVNPCLVVGARNAALSCEPAAQDPEKWISFRTTQADIDQCGEVDRGARDSERILGRA
jgi:hypothetical protein